MSGFTDRAKPGPRALDGFDVRCLGLGMSDDQQPSVALKRQRHRTKFRHAIVQDRLATTKVAVRPPLSREPTQSEAILLSRRGSRRGLRLARGDADRGGRRDRLRC